MSTTTTPTTTPPPITLSQLQQQNTHLQQVITQYIQQINQLKKVNQQHQKEIQNLLKFNQRLLTIIEEQVNNNPNKNIQRSLQPISQVTEVDSETMDQMMQSLQKTRSKLAARSQRGAPYRSQMDIKNDYNKNDHYNNSHAQSLSNYNIHGNNNNNGNNSNNPTNNNNPTTNNYMNTLNYYLTESKDLERSQRYVPTVQKQHSEFGNKSSFSKKRQKKPIYGNNNNLYNNNNNTYYGNSNNNNNNNNDNSRVIPDSKETLQFGSRKELIDHQLSMEELQRASTDARPLAVMKQLIDMDNYQDNYKGNLNIGQNHDDSVHNNKNILPPPTITINKHHQKHQNQQYSTIQKQITQKMNWQIQQMRKNSQMNHQFLDQKINQLNQLSKEIVYNPQQKFNQLQSKIKLAPHLAQLVRRAMVAKSK